MENHISKGIITYMYLENFVTHDKVVIKPEKNLNVIIGPNGTGKSTIMCAIVLGLGGKLSTIGRAVHVTEYIKAGCEQAKIEIHLKNDEHNDFIISRSFNKQGKSIWALNGKPSNIKAVQDMTKSLNIQIDNLCQFLPQDKVQDFSKMNAQELLENTERSVADPVVLENHQKLINFRKHCKELETDIASKKNILESKIQIHEGLKESVSRIKEKKRIKKKMVALKQKKAWILYDQSRRELAELNTKKKEVETEVKSLEVEIKPINDAISKLNSQIKILQNSMVDHNIKVNNETTKLKNMMDSILECDNQIERCKNKCKQRIETEEARDKDIELARQQKSKLDNDLSLMLQEIGSEGLLLKQRQVIQHSMEKQRNNINAMTIKKQKFAIEEDRIIRDIRSQESKLLLSDINAKRSELLAASSIDAYKAVQWLRENRNKFSAPVYEPMLLNINVKDASYARYLESIIPHRDLIAFVCENKEDMNLLMKCLRDEQKWQVNVVHSDPMKNVSMNPQIPLENIKRFGFVNYLVSLIEAPVTIMKFLVSMYHLNNIPIGTNLVEDYVDQLPRNLRCFFSENNLYFVSTSKYTGENSTRIQSIHSSGLLAIVSDKSKIHAIEENLIALREKKENARSKALRVDEEIVKENKELDAYRANKNKIQHDLQQIQTLKSRISRLGEKLKSLEEERTSIEEIKKTLTSDVQVILNKQLKLYGKYNTGLEDCLKFVTANEEIKFVIKLQSRSLLAKTNDSQDLREKLKTAEEKVKQAKQELLPLRNAVERIYKEALETTGGIGPSQKDFAPINKAFKKLPPTVEEINNELNDAQAKVFCMTNNMEGENALQEYEAVENDIKKLKEYIEIKTQELKNSEQEIQLVRENWLTSLTEIVKNINTNFSHYFSAMQCTGEVTLSHGENMMDFDQYGLKIRVKFRDADQLQELTRHHQSGGERAVTTAIYMISLQELTKVPFRCVDEINQGMDALNERRVFNLLVKITARKNSSQYFLITPKLLPGLEYSETVTVHCVFNGPFMISHTEFDTEGYCRIVNKALEKDS